ncbi:S8 family serine peptidase (plasmid) [Streptomyces sp. HUAS 31]|uniref:cyanobactin maturation protease PatG family protein n=1 Tax=Streptomyces sp. HUAS 31 TaxID=3020055 RepID=UPI0023061DFF|nr:S8 family serine peptidase [Streptomyces sp. HUAS 31]WCE02530.1 S8 family serine peptidase [Streptomyces sp. HUAS 31]
MDIRSVLRGVPGEAELLGDPGVRVAVLDGPVDMTHPCFAGANLTRLATLVSDPAGTGPMSLHGTHVTSLLFGQAPVAGLIPRCTGLLLPVFREAPDGRVSRVPQLDLARAVERAVEAGAHIINISGGERTPDGRAEALLERALRLCQDNGVLVVAAVGNDGCDCLQAPAATPSVLAVGATDANGKPLDINNWGPAYRANGVLAPGRDIDGAAPGGRLAALTGSSFATPAVTGVAALLVAQQIAEGRTIDPLAAGRAIRESTSRPPCASDDAPECRRLLGGRLDAERAFELVREGTSAVPQGLRSAALSPAGEILTPLTNHAEPKGTAIVMDTNAVHAHAGDTAEGTSAAEVPQTATETPSATPAQAQAQAPMPMPQAGPAAAPSPVGTPSPAPATPPTWPGAMPQAIPQPEPQGVQQGFAQPEFAPGVQPAAPPTAQPMTHAVAQPAPQPLAQQTPLPQPEPQGMQQAFAQPEFAPGVQPAAPPTAQPMTHAVAQPAPQPLAQQAPLPSASTTVPVTPSQVEQGVRPSCPDCGGTCGGQPNQGTAASAAAPVNGDSRQLIYAIGTIGFDFQTDAVRDSFRQLMPNVVKPATGSEPEQEQQPNIYDPKQLHAYLSKNPWASDKLTWTLNHDAMPIYALEAEVPVGMDWTRPIISDLKDSTDKVQEQSQSAAGDKDKLAQVLETLSYPPVSVIHRTFRDAIVGQAKNTKDLDFISRVSIPGVLTDRTVRLFSGQVVPVVEVKSRALFTWNETLLVKAVISAVVEKRVQEARQKVKDEGGSLAQQNDAEKQVRKEFAGKKGEFLEKSVRALLSKVYWKFRNLGQTAADRALNAAGTNAFLVGHEIQDGILSAEHVPGSSNNFYSLDTVTVSKSPFCRHGAVCMDVVLTFFDPENDQRAPVSYLFTFDVSGEVPVSLAPVHTFIGSY